ncbi:hypothetical protein G6F65_023199 [Rhizopus arrhizus]|nr:hypothetical protein G6F65_023199 [Rhizopus arrhizus]
MPWGSVPICGLPARRPGRPGSRGCGPACGSWRVGSGSCAWPRRSRCLPPAARPTRAEGSGRGAPWCASHLLQKAESYPYTVQREHEWTLAFDAPIACGQRYLPPLQRAGL